MKSGFCPKCGSEDIHVGKVQQAVAITLISGTFPASYVCTSCGYMETYIIDGGALEKIAEKWPSAQTVKRKNDEV